MRGNGDDAEAEQGRTWQVPRWVRLAVIGLVVLVLLAVVLTMSGLTGEHGPARHSSAPGGDLTTAVPAGSPRWP
jgi:hypothetical protein